MSGLQELSIEKILHFRGTKPRNMLDRGRYFFKLLTKYLDSTYEPDPQPEDPGRRVMKYSLKRVGAALLKDGNLEFLKVLMPGMDNIVANTVMQLKRYKAGGYKNYVPSRAFYEVMRKINMDVPSEVIPSDLKAYFELAKADGRYEWALVDVEVEGEHRFLHLTRWDLQVKAQGPNHTYMPLAAGKSLQELFNGLGYKEYDGNGMKIIPQVPVEDDECMKAIFNLLIYVTGPNEEFLEEMNKFSANNKQRQVEQLTYTEQKFIKIGSEVERLTMREVGQTDVRGHWRWARVGAGRLQRRLTFVEPHTRNYQKAAEPQEAT